MKGLWGWWRRSTWLYFLPAISLNSEEIWKKTHHHTSDFCKHSFPFDWTHRHSWPPIFVSPEGRKEGRLCSPPWLGQGRRWCLDQLLISQSTEKETFFSPSVVVSHMSFTEDTSIFRPLTVMYWTFPQLIFYIKSFYSFVATKKIWVNFGF